MQRWIKILSVVLVVQVVLAGGLLLRGDQLAPARDNAPFIAAELKDVDKISIDGPVSAQAAEKKEEKKEDAATRVELVRRDGAWIMPANFDAPADKKKIDALLKQLTEARRGMPIATTAQALERFKVAEKEYERRVVLSQGDKVLATVYLSAAPGGRKANARTSDDSAVYSVDVATYDVPAASNEWFDRTLLQPDTATLARIEVAEAGKPALTLRRSLPAASQDNGADKKEDGKPAEETKVADNTKPADAKPAEDTKPAEENKAAEDKKLAEENKPAAAPAWSADGLASGERLDTAKVDTLVHAIGAVRVDHVLGKEPPAGLQSNPPRLRLTIADAQDKAVTWSVMKPKTGDTYVLKASNRPWYFEMKSWDANPLLEAAARDKLVTK